MEERGELAKAILLYLEDATACLDGDSLVRAALGTTCAADCLVTMGLRGKGRRLYHVAGMLYWDNSDSRLEAPFGSPSGRFKRRTRPSCSLARKTTRST